MNLVAPKEASLLPILTERGKKPFPLLSVTLLTALVLGEGHATFRVAKCEEYFHRFSFSVPFTARGPARCLL